MTKPGETRGKSRQLSQPILAERTSHEGYVKVSLDTIKSYEDGSRNPSTELLASLYRALEATPDEFPAGALAEASYLMSRWLAEAAADLDVALERREQILRLIRRPEDEAPPGPPDQLRRPVEDPPPSSDTEGRPPPAPEEDAP